MSSKTINSGSATKVRQRSKKRATRHQVVCERREAGNNDAAVIANSIYQLKLADKKGPEVYKILGFGESANFSFEPFYKDVFGAFAVAKRIIKKEKVFDCHNAGVELITSLYHILTELKKMIPADFEFNIEEDEDGHYYIEVFRNPKFSEGWLCFEIKYLVNKLSYESKPLHDLFLSFLKMVSAGFGVDLWFSGHMGGTIEMMEEYIENMKDDYANDTDAKDHEKEGNDDGMTHILNYEDDMNEYQSGKPYDYQKRIIKSKKYKPDELIRKLKRIRKAPGIRKLIIEGCELLKAGYNLGQYHSPRYFIERENNYFLELHSQVNIIWDIADNLTAEHEQSLDASAQEGVEAPMVWLKITPETKRIDFEELRRKNDWIEKMADFFSNAHETIEKYIHES